MPLCYGGGVKTRRAVERIVSLGVEKVAVSAAAVARPRADRRGGQPRRQPERGGGHRREHGKNAARRSAPTTATRATRPEARCDFARQAQAAGRRRDRGQLDRSRRPDEGLRPGAGARQVRAASTLPHDRAGRRRHRWRDMAALVREFGIDRRGGRQPVRLQGRVPGGAHQLPVPRATRTPSLVRWRSANNRMKQILQNLKTGETDVADAPSPRAGRGQLLIRTTRTLVSAGTERMLVDFGKAALHRQGAPAARQGAHGAGQGAHRWAAADDRGGAQQARPAAAAGLLQRRRGGRGGRRGRAASRSATGWSPTASTPSGQRAGESVRQGCRTG